MSNVALTGHMIRSEMASDDGSCRVKCYLEPNCASVNVGPLDRRGHDCELNNANEESVSHSAMKGRQGYTFHSAEVQLFCGLWLCVVILHYFIHINN